MRAAAFSAVASIVLATTAAAQIPNPLRKAKERAAQAVSGQPAASNKPLAFDNVMLELTPRVINQVIVGLKVRAGTKGPDGRNVSDLRRRANELADESRQLNENRSNDRFEYNNKLGAAENCVSEVLSGINGEHMQAMQRRFMGMTGANLQGDHSANAKFMQEYQRVSMAIAEASAANDTAKMNKLQAEYNKLMGINPKADSAKARAQCNVPPPPAWMARADAVQDSSNALFNQARDLERMTSDTVVRVTGLSAEQFAMAAERLTAYASGAVANSSMWKFTAAEEIAIKARLVELKPLVG